MKITFYWYVLFIPNLPTFRVAQYVKGKVNKRLKKGKANNLWVTSSNHAPVLLFISLEEFYKCISGAYVIDYEFLNRGCYNVLESYHPWKNCKVSHSTLNSLYSYTTKWNLTVNVEKSNIVIFRNGGKIRSDKKMVFEWG